MNRASPSIAALLIVLTGCTAPARGPSLLPRAVEARSSAEPVRPTPVATPDAALDAQIAERTRAFAQAAATFERQAAALEGAIMRGRSAREGSDAWVSGQLALGELSQARAAVESSLAAIEELAIARESARQPAYPSLDAALADASMRLERIANRDAALRPAA
jgi:hypothetical protein